MHKALTYPTLSQRALPHAGLWRELALVLGGALVIALLSQLEIPLRPVPITLQTLAVLLVGASLGWRRGALSVLAYLLAGAAGLPVFSGGGAGLVKLLGPTGGYLAGFLLAAALVGWLAERFGLDRTPWGTGLAMLAGNAAIYALGLPWLSQVTGLHGSALLSAGLTPFLLGDTLKLLLAAGLLPAAWAVLGRRR